MVDINLLIKTYKDAQQRIIDTILSGKNVSQQRVLLNNVNKELARLQGETVGWVESNIPEAYRQGMDLANAEYAKQYAAAGAAVPFEYPSEFVVVNRQAIETLIENVTSDFDQAINFVGRRVKDDVRKASLQAIADKVATGSTIQKTKDILAKQYADQGLAAIKYTRNGKDVYMNLNSYAEVVARSSTSEATNTATITQVTAIGNDLVQMTSHSSTCPICAPLEGRVYSISGKNPNYPPLDKAYTGEYANIHPNCGHRMVPYIEDLQTSDKLAKDREFSNRSFDVDKWTEAQRNKAKSSIDSYNNSQKNKREIYNDRRQWERYKERLGPEYAPKSFSSFRRIKNDEQAMGVLNAQYKAMGYYNKAIANEFEITGQVAKAAKEVGMDQAGLEFKVKEKESYLRKVKANYKPKGNEYEIKDILRFTYTAGPNELTEKTMQSIAEHGKYGYNTIEIKNTWKPNSPYKGVNTIVQAPNGQKFELQYHTPESFKLKNGRLHTLYEKARKLDRDSEEYIKLNDEMIELSSKLTSPGGIERVKNK